MQIVDNLALLLRLRNPKQVTTIIPKSKQLENNEVAVYWGVNEAQTLRAMNIKAPSPIEGRYDWPGKFKPMSHQRTTSSFLTLNKRAFCFNEQGTGKTASAIWAASGVDGQVGVTRVDMGQPLGNLQFPYAYDLYNPADTLGHHTTASAFIEDDEILNLDKIKEHV